MTDGFILDTAPAWAAETTKRVNRLTDATSCIDLGIGQIRRIA